MDNLFIFSGNANTELAAQVVDYLKVPLGNARVEQFSDGEITVEIQENVRGRDVFVIQPTCAPSHKNLMELLLMVDACKRSSARRITAVMPYYGYARQDRRPRNSRVPISAKLIASMVSTAGADRVLTMDLHADQIQGFFDIPTDNIYGSPVLLEDIRNLEEDKLVVVSPDVGGVVRARALAKRLGVDLAIIDKRRPKANVAVVMNIIGDVKGRSCVLIDDMVDTANTLCKAADALKEQGATAVRAYCTHAVLSGEAVTRINASDMDEVVVTNTIPLSDAATASNKIRQLSIAHLLGESIRRITVSDSVSSLFTEED
ncbi:MAG: ribose-phosphate pyrophosphokinase, partial [Acidiferrobacterales bacterium]|nr:ribose-phosphate pyrophosphokinase [Acidiferrobacterales bacterium]